MSGAALTGGAVAAISEWVAAAPASQTRAFQLQESSQPGAVMCGALWVWFDGRTAPECVCHVHEATGPECVAACARFITNGGRL